MHSRKVDGRSLRFGHRGWLWHNAYINYDIETDSLWHHQTGWALAGPLRGKALARFPTTLTTWLAWRTEHPTTLVLPKSPTDPRPIDHDVYRERNSGLTIGLGLDLPGAFRLYPFDALRAADGLIEETVDGVPLVIALDAQGRTAFAYDRRVDGATLDFELDAGRATPLLRERGGPRSFRLRSGRGEDRATGSSDLVRLHTSHWEAFAWKQQHPGGTRWVGDPAHKSVPDRGR